MKRYLIIALIAAAVTVVVLELLTPLALFISLLIGALIGGAVVVLLLALSRGEQPEAIVREVAAAARETVSEPPTRAKERRVQQQLFSSYEKLVLAGVAPLVAPALQALVVTLRDVVPRALQFSEHSETTFNLVKLASEDLPSQVASYLALGPADRDASRGAFIAQLDQLTAKVGELALFIDAGQADAFNAQSEFLNVKFEL